MTTRSSPHRVVIVGGGFAGLEAAKALRGAPVDITLLDRRNHHLFQPLLYQVATGGLSPGDIASPLRAVLARQRNVRVLAAEVVDLAAGENAVLLADGELLVYDTLVVATGMRTHHFGNDAWAPHAPGLKSVEDALEMRRRILAAFERAERETDTAARRALLTFVVVGGGPTGVELCGALAELGRHTMRHDFRAIDPTEARIVLVEVLDRVLAAYPPELSDAAAERLRAMGVELRLGHRVTAVDAEGVTLRAADDSGPSGDSSGDSSDAGTIDPRIAARTVLWAAGLRATALAERLAERRGAALDRAGRVRVAEDLSLPGHGEILVVGDLAHVEDDAGGALPGIAPVAMQQGRHAARVVRARVAGEAPPAFRYRDRGVMAVIGRNAAVADLGRLRLAGFPAWLLWVFVHIAFLIGFDNKLRVMLQWAWMYATRKRGARLITERAPVAPRDAAG